MVAGAVRLKVAAQHAGSSSAYASHCAKVRACAFSEHSFLLVFQERKSSAVVLPSLDVVSANYPQAKPSRKMYGRKVSVLHCVINLQSILQFNSILQFFSIIIMHKHVL